MPFEQPATTVAIGGLRSKVKSARLLASGQPVKFEQDDIAARFQGLSANAPDQPITVIEAECETEPLIDSTYLRKNRPRDGV